MQESFEHVLGKAEAAMARGDRLSAIRHAMAAAGAPKGYTPVRCEALLIVAQACYDLGLAEEALSSAIGAQLAACWGGDAKREGRAAAMVTMVNARYPGLGHDLIEVSNHQDHRCES